MANRLGMVLEFKPGVTREQVMEALMRIRDVVDLPGGSQAQKHVREYDDEWGGPVWYIP